MPDITGSKAVNNAVISTNITVELGKWTIGYIRSITETQARPVNPQYEVGTVGPIDMIPSQPAAVTLACAKVAIYGANLVNVIANAIDTDQGTAIFTAPGLSALETQTAMKAWLGKYQGQGGGGNLKDVFTLSALPIGFIIKINETFSGDANKVLITEYHNCWIVRYTRPIVSSGDLLVAETADINCQFVKYNNLTSRSITTTNGQSIVELIPQAG